MSVIAATPSWSPARYRAHPGAGSDPTCLDRNIPVRLCSGMEAPFTVLAEPARRQILDHLRERPCMVGELTAVLRSEEHTSELQSQFHLVCRLLLEKKKDELSQLELSEIVEMFGL